MCIRNDLKFNNRSSYMEEGIGELEFWEDYDDLESLCCTHLALTDPNLFMNLHFYQSDIDNKMFLSHKFGSMIEMQRQIQIIESFFG